MAVNIHNLISAISPDLYCDKELNKKVKSIIKENNYQIKGYLAAEKEAKPIEPEYIDFVGLESKNLADSPGLKSPIEKHKLIYDSFGEGLEPIYFWLLDNMQESFKKVDKIVDNFVTSPGSAQFAEIYTTMGARATKVQDEVSKIMGTANTVLKSIINLLYDLKEFKMRLAIYDKLKSKDKAESKAAMLSLKQIWMDTVDMKRGNSSIKALALSQQGGFVTLIDAFMAIEDENLMYQGKEIDLNDRIKRLLQQRMIEYKIWVEESEKELRKRFEIEKTYLKSQVSMVQMYSRWVKPYLKAARDYEQRMSPNAALVNSFNTSLFEIVLLGESPYKADEDLAKGELPISIKELIKSKKLRNYNSVMILEFSFRTAPERTGQGFGFRGKVEVTFTSYGLSDEEMKVLRECLKQDDLDDALGLIEGATTESLDKIKMDLEEFLGPEKKDESARKAKEEDTNPFSAIIDGFKDLFKSESKSQEKNETDFKEINKDNYFEKMLRSQAIIEARRTCYKIYDSYKKAHKMASLPGYA